MVYTLTCSQATNLQWCHSSL